MLRIGRMYVWPIGINQMCVTPQTSCIAIRICKSTTFTSAAQVCTSYAWGRVVMGELKRMIVTVSSSSRLPLSARVCLCLPLSASVCPCLSLSGRVSETDCHVSHSIISTSFFMAWFSFLNMVSQTKILLLTIS